jgi:hypothetical protein
VSLAWERFIFGRRGNLWVTDTLQCWPEARLAQTANLMWDSARFQLFALCSQLPGGITTPPQSQRP